MRSTNSPALCYLTAVKTDGPQQGDSGARGLLPPRPGHQAHSKFAFPTLFESAAFIIITANLVLCKLN